ncbi:GNAT family N-acetyltransferase [Paenibacillus caui]|uniref:GNAT family N-acetyltransferase n=1 Tax=Paenibacillus caui TaxID=2873927 RepID=UPI001CA87FC2|nr:GNAT family N-acetyltransferase [Paenibacillus caui]
MTPERPEQKTNVQLAFYEPEHQAVLESFYLPEEKKQFTGMPNEVLGSAIQEQHKHPVVILADTRPVGFFILDGGEDVHGFTDSPHALLLRSFSINEKDQGKGYAKQAMLQLRAFVREHFPEIRLVVLAVNARNAPAKSLYLKCGFEDHGAIRVGPIGTQHILTCSV